MKVKRSITVVGAHAEGEVGRVITGGVLPPAGATVAEMKRTLEADDKLRRFLLYEPRGGAFCHINLIVPPSDPKADAGFIIMEPQDYPPMSGSNSICVATVLLETGMLPMYEPITRLTLEAPGGLVTVEAQCAEGKVTSVEVTNVPSFVLALDQEIDVPGIGAVRYDLVYGGDSFAIVDAGDFDFALTREEARTIVEMGEAIKKELNERISFSHPHNPDVRRISFIQFAGPIAPSPEDGVLEGYNAVVISPGKIDRSPTGTGTSARLALLHRRREIAKGTAYRSRSILGTRFDARVVEETEVGAFPAIVPAIKGRAWLTGFHTYTLDPDDPFPEGYTLSDTWYSALD